MIEIVKYESKYKPRWDDFIKRSKNGTFMFYRDYMEYHSSRFIDSSLLFFNEDALIAVMPANISEKVLYSHGGLTFGGIVSDYKMTLSVMLELFEQLTAYLKAQGITKFLYKVIPHIYHNAPAEEDLYALFRFNARLVRRDASATILLKNRLPYSKKRRSKIKRATKEGLVVTKSNDFTTLISLLKEHLKSKHNVNPTHTAQELSSLASRFPNNIKLFSVYENDEMVAGVVTYENQKVVHAQYNGFSQRGREVGATELVFDYLINEYSSKKDYFDFGISTEQGGIFLNTGLAAYKERFGGRATTYDFFEMDLTRKSSATCVDPSAIIASTARILGEAKIDRGVIIHDFATVYTNVHIEPNVEVFEGAVIGRPPTATRAIMRQVSAQLKPTKIGVGSVISPHAVIYADVHIGEDTLIGDNVSIREQCRIGKKCIIGRNVTVQFNTTIGDASTIMDLTAITGNMIIGSHVFISALVATTNDNYFSRKGYDESFVRGPIIEDYAMVGAGANILPGVRIGAGALVGAGAVVTRDVPPKKLVMGIPARIVEDVEFREDTKQERRI